MYKCSYFGSTNIVEETEENQTFSKKKGRLENLLEPLIYGKKKQFINVEIVKVCLFNHYILTKIKKEKS